MQAPEPSCVPVVIEGVTLRKEKKRAFVIGKGVALIINRSAARIIEGFDGVKSLGEIMEKLKHDYPNTDEKIIERDVLDLALKLSDSKVVRFEK